MAHPFKTSSLDDRVYMVNAEDENGDHHVFVSMNRGRAEARYQVALKAFRNVKANWLKRQVEQGQSGH